MSALRANCGSFQPRRHDGQRLVTGGVNAFDAGGMKLVHVVNDLKAVSRDWRDVRTDHVEDLLLLLALQGVSDVEHVGNRTTMGPGDLVLVDAAKPIVIGNRSGFGTIYPYMCPANISSPTTPAPSSSANDSRPRIP